MLRPETLRAVTLNLTDPCKLVNLTQRLRQQLEDNKFLQNCAERVIQRGKCYY